MLERFLFVAISCLGISFSLMAKDFQGHNSDLRRIILGYNPVLSPEGKNKFDLLCKAARLTLDYTNKSYGAVDLAELGQNGIKNLPPVSEISYSSNQYHEKYTHMGWCYGNGGYINNLFDWDRRKDILIETVRYVGCFNEKEQIKIEAFAQLIYDVHILGDHANNSLLTIKTRMPLAPEKTFQNIVVTGTSDGIRNYPTVLTELQYCILRLFREQNNDAQIILSFLRNHQAELMKTDINQSQNNTRDTKEKEIRIKSLANLTLEELRREIPKLLKNERWFNESFLMND